MDTLYTPAYRINHRSKDQPIGLDYSDNG